MIVVGVRVTRISTDGCAVRMQFVVGLHSVPYLFNCVSLSLTQEHPAAGCSFLLPFYAPTSASTEIWHSGAAPRGSLVPWRSGGTSPQSFLSRSCRKRGYPQEFSTVWRTYMRVILAPCAGGLMCLKNSRRLENSCNYRLLRSLKPRGNS